MIAAIENPKTMPDGFYPCDDIDPLRPVIGPRTREDMDPSRWHSSFRNLRVVQIADGKVVATWPYMAAVNGAP